MACVGGVRFDDFGRRKLVARGSRYAPMPSASFGEFNRIAVRIMSSHRTLPGLFVRGFEKKYSSGLQMFIQDVEIIRSQFNMNPCSLLWRHADRSQRICAIVREQSNRAASRTSHADHCKLRGLVDRDAQREPLQSDFQHGTFPLVHMRRRSGCGTKSMSCSCSKLKIEASRATRRITLRMMIGIKLRIDVLYVCTRHMRRSRVMAADDVVGASDRSLTCDGEQYRPRPRMPARSIRKRKQLRRVGTSHSCQQPTFRLHIY